MPDQTDRANEIRHLKHPAIFLTNTLHHLNLTWATLRYDFQYPRDRLLPRIIINTKPCAISKPVQVFCKEVSLASFFLIFQYNKSDEISPIAQGEDIPPHHGDSDICLRQRVFYQILFRCRKGEN